MKKAFLISVFCLSLFSNSLQAQRNEYPYYVIAGSFASEENAAQFESEVHAKNYPARHAYNPDRKLHYVYVSVNDEKSRARDIVYKLRSEGVFKDAWVYNGPFTANELPGPIARNTTTVATGLPGNHGGMAGGIAEPDEMHNNVVMESHAIEPSMVADKPMSSMQRAFVFQLIDEDTGEPVKGNVTVTESEKDDHYESFEANETVYVQPPQNARGSLVVVCDIVGYAFQKKAINFKSMAKKAAEKSGATPEIVVPIKLRPFRRGDYIDLNNVEFYDHAVIMKSESEDELMELVHFMEDPHSKIRIHGHTSSEASEEITTLGKSSNFFSSDPANQHTYATAKELSKFRADAIKSYLVSKGIDEKQILTKGHGGMVAIYDNAEANERIEVEIIKH